VFALTGLVIGVVLAVAARLAAGSSGWRAALVAAAPSLGVTLPAAWAVAGSGLPVASVVPWLAAGALWPATAAMVALGRRLTGDRMGQSIAIVALAGSLGGVVWLERQLLGGAPPLVHVAATLTLLALAGAALRVAYRGGFAGWLAAVIAALALGTGSAALGYGLRTRLERQRFVVLGEHARELVWLWREVLAVPRLDHCGDGCGESGPAPGEPR